MIRRYVSPDDAAPTLDVYTRGERETARHDYTDWDARLAAASTHVFEVDRVIAGLVSVDSPGHVDLLVVAPEFSRRGIAVALLDSLGDGPLFTDASVATRGFFEGQGFVLVSVPRVGGPTSYRMSRD